MKTLLKSRKELQAAGRWDIDYHLPPEGITKFPGKLLLRVDQVADVARDKRDPTREPDIAFQYVDIAAVDVAIGQIANPQDVEGSEAPSRARKVVRAFDVVVSTCRPTRGAIAVVPVRLHNQIASTAFSIIRAYSGVNPFYLHYALRLPSTLEQFRKWSTGSSYPAILDSDVKKTVIPVPNSDVQDCIAAKVVNALRERAKVIRAANEVWTRTLSEITATLCGIQPNGAADLTEYEDELGVHSIADIAATLKELPPLATDNGEEISEEEGLFVDSDLDPRL